MFNSSRGSLWISSSCGAIFDERPVVTFIEEGSSARIAGVELGHVLLKVNGIDVKNNEEASRLIKEGPRPLTLLFFVPAMLAIRVGGGGSGKSSSSSATSYYNIAAAAGGVSPSAAMRGGTDKDKNDPRRMTAALDATATATTRGIAKRRGGQRHAG
jgi:membrane-associated protease RseP (regulator of RpoE activity)